MAKRVDDRHSPQRCAATARTCAARLDASPARCRAGSRAFAGACSVVDGFNTGAAVLDRDDARDVTGGFAIDDELPERAPAPSTVVPPPDVLCPRPRPCPHPSAVIRQCVASDTTRRGDGPVAY